MRASKLPCGRSCRARVPEHRGAGWGSPDGRVHTDVGKFLGLPGSEGRISHVARGPGWARGARGGHFARTPEAGMPLRVAAGGPLGDRRPWVAGAQ